MNTHRVLVAALGLSALVGATPRHYAAVPTRVPLGSTGAPDACALLSTSDVSTALEVASLPGRHAFGNSPLACIWSDDTTGSFGNRRVTLTIMSMQAYTMGKSNPVIITEAAPGIGDDAFYELFKGKESPFLCVKVGGSAFQVRVLNGLKLKPFTLEQEKAKEAALAKAAVGRL